MNFHFFSSPSHYPDGCLLFIVYCSLLSSPIHICIKINHISIRWFYVSKNVKCLWMLCVVRIVGLWRCLICQCFVRSVRRKCIGAIHGNYKLIMCAEASINLSIFRYFRLKWQNSTRIHHKCIKFFKWAFCTQFIHKLHATFHKPNI